MWRNVFGQAIRDVTMTVAIFRSNSSSILDCLTWRWQLFGPSKPQELTVQRRDLPSKKSSHSIQLCNFDIILGINNART